MLFLLDNVDIASFYIITTSKLCGVFHCKSQSVSNINTICFFFLFTLITSETIPEKRFYCSDSTVFSCAEPEEVPLCAEIKSSPKASSVSSSYVSCSNFASVRDAL